MSDSDSDASSASAPPPTSSDVTFDEVFGGDDGFEFFANEPPPPTSDNEEELVFDDLFGSEDEADDLSASASSHSIPTPSLPSTLLTAHRKVKRPKSKQERAVIARLIARKRKAEMEDLPFSRVCKRISSQRRVARTVREVPVSELRVITLRLVRLMKDAAKKDNAALALGTLAVEKITTLTQVKSMLTNGGTQLSTFLTSQPAFFSAVHMWLAPSSGMLPALDIRTTLVDILLANFPRIGYEVLRESKIGRVIKFLSECKKETTRNSAVCKRIIQNWARNREDESSAVAQRVSVRNVNYAKLAVRSIRAERSSGLRNRVLTTAPTVGVLVRQQRQRVRIPETVHLNFTVAPKDKFTHLELQQGSAGDKLKKTSLRTKLSQLKRRR